VNDEIATGRMFDKYGNVYNTIESGKFVKGKLQGKVKIEYSSGNVYEG
jgi:hypothetical protein